MSANNKNSKYKFLFFPLMALCFVGVAGGVIMFLWNTIVPSLITGVGLLTWPKAIGLFILCRILFGGFKSGHRGKGCNNNGFNRHFNKEKMWHMTDEEKEKFKAEWQQRWHNK